MNDRIVTCNIINNLDIPLSRFDYAPGGTESNSRYNGKWIEVNGNSFPAAQIPAGGVETEAFSINRTGPAQGSTGYVIYNTVMNNSTNTSIQLVLMFSNPSNRQGKGSNQNCWFYAIIQGDTTTSFNTAVPVGQDLQVKASWQGLNMDNSPPTPWSIDPNRPEDSECNNIQVTVTLDYISTF